MKRFQLLFLMGLFHLIFLKSECYAWFGDELLPEGCRLSFSLSSNANPLTVKEGPNSRRLTLAWSSDYDCHHFVRTQVFPKVTPFHTESFSELLSLYAESVRSMSTAELKLAREIEKNLDTYFSNQTMGEFSIHKTKHQFNVKGSKGFGQESEFVGTGRTLAEAFQNAFQLRGQSLVALEKVYFRAYLSKVSKLTPANQILQALYQLKLEPSFQDSLRVFSLSQQMDTSDPVKLYQGLANLYHEMVRARAEGKVDPREKRFFKSLRIPTFHENISSLETQVPFELIETAILENQVPSRGFVCSIF